MQAKLIQQNDNIGELEAKIVYMQEEMEKVCLIYFLDLRLVYRVHFLVKRFVY